MLKLTHREDLIPLLVQALRNALPETKNRE